MEWASDEELEDSGSEFEEKTSRGKRKSIYKENSDDDESDDAWAPGKALKASIYIRHHFLIVAFESRLRRA